MASIITPPNNGLINETGQQYYSGSQSFRGDGVETKFTTTFNTNLYLGTWNPQLPNYALNNFKIYTSLTGIAGTWSEYITSFSMVDNVIDFANTGAPAANLFIAVQLTMLDGGKYASTNAEKAFGQTVEDNYGGYQYLKLNNIVSNFMVGYVGKDKLLPTVKRTDVIFFAIL